MCLGRGLEDVSVSVGKAERGRVDRSVGMYLFDDRDVIAQRRSDYYLVVRILVFVAKGVVCKSRMW